MNVDSLRRSKIAMHEAEYVYPYDNDYTRVILGTVTSHNWVKVEDKDDAPLESLPYVHKHTILVLLHRVATFLPAAMPLQKDWLHTDVA